MTINETVAGANRVAINGTASGETSRGVIGPATTQRCLNVIDAPAPSRLSRHTSGRFCRMLALILGLCTLAAQAEEFNFRYVSLNDAQMPAGFRKFRIAGIDDLGRVYGTVFTQGPIRLTYIAVYDKGVISVLQRGDMFFASGTAPVNNRGNVGGFVQATDNFWDGVQAALFNKKKVELIRKLPGAIFEDVVGLDDSNTALVWSEDPSGQWRNSYRLVKNGKTTFQYQIRPTGTDCSGCWGVNNQGVVAGWIWEPDLNASRGIRFQPPYYNPQLLDPLPGDANSEAIDINNRGYVLGVSTNDPSFNPPYSVGVWDRNGDFETYSVEIMSFSAIFNDKNLIVLTNTEDNISYLVPEPGLRLNLEDLVVNPASVQGPFINVLDINKRGDMIGTGLFDVTTSLVQNFLLERIERGQH